MSFLDKVLQSWKPPHIKLLIGKEPIHVTRVKSETHKMFEVTSQRCEHVTSKMLKFSQHARKLPPLSVDPAHPFTLFSHAKNIDYLVRENYT